ncbi:dolichyl-phosphate beta-glucosyltransferase [Bdellovibrio svalbardensis]|uniref:dolichyl-phosphate beta-glucosyltransferase n=1 Tax=Bdellovibrio svalbardensis TaxID=2972972 RepID=A0ABT6DHH3_9BACT|nr:dolichyl-phosphate beta-glucosyltransferase [Bdellovibrio svalbardensis]MDG0816311.1 glycosyltransferase family 2 protein [Bdellovibrio svalbardensis]
MKELSVVIPAYNEESRLPQTLEVLRKLCNEQALQWQLREVLVSDDGSLDGTAAFVNNFAKSWPLLKLVNLPQNQGKGAAVRLGMQQAQSEWILIADADMATPWEEMNKFAQICEGFDLVMGSRALAQSEITVRQHWIRQSMGKTFNKILKSLVNLPYQDTQCGFKLVRNDASFRKDILTKLSVDRFAWDVELILQMQKNKKRILESPIRWSHQEASRVRMFRDSLEMFFTVVKLRLRLK